LPDYPATATRGEKTIRWLSRRVRKPVVRRGRSGWVVSYRFEPEHDTVLILFLRHQRKHDR